MELLTQTPHTPLGREGGGGARFDVVTSSELVLSSAVAPLTTDDTGAVQLDVRATLVVVKREMALVLTDLEPALQPCCLLGQ